jgi:hypothetical protein
LSAEANAFFLQMFGLLIAEPEPNKNMKTATAQQHILLVFITTEQQTRQIAAKYYLN